MAKETKAEREARLQQEQAERHEQERVTYPARLMTLLERACNLSYTLEVCAGAFVVCNRNESDCNVYKLFPSYSKDTEEHLQNFEWDVTYTEQERAKAAKEREARAAALAKLTPEECRLLNVQ